MTQPFAMMLRGALANAAALVKIALERHGDAVDPPYPERPEDETLTFFDAELRFAIKLEGQRLDRTLQTIEKTLDDVEKLPQCIQAGFFRLYQFGSIYAHLRDLLLLVKTDPSQERDPLFSPLDAQFCETIRERCVRSSATKAQQDRWAKETAVLDRAVALARAKWTAGDPADHAEMAEHVAAKVECTKARLMRHPPFKKLARELGRMKGVKGYRKKGEIITPPL